MMTSAPEAARRRVAGILLIAVTLIATLALTPSCNTYSVVAIESDELHSHEQTRHQFLWGIVGGPVIVRPTSDDAEHTCESYSLHEVSVSTNFGYALITVLTLGIWSPANVEWTCATVDDEQEDLPIPGRSDDRAEDESDGS